MSVLSSPSSRDVNVTESYNKHQLSKEPNHWQTYLFQLGGISYSLLFSKPFFDFEMLDKGINFKMFTSSSYVMIIRIITKLPNSEQSYKGKVKTHNYINRQNQSTTGKLWTVNLCHHLAIVICLWAFHILIISYETTVPVGTKLCRKDVWEVLYIKSSFYLDLTKKTMDHSFYFSWLLLWKYFSSWVSIFVVWLKITSSWICKFMDFVFVPK